MLLSVAGLAVKTLIRKKGKFPNTHVSGNPHLREQGIYCATTQDRMEQDKARKERRYKGLTLMPGQDKSGNGTVISGDTP